MKKQLPALLLLALFAFAACKKDGAPGKTTKSADTVVTAQPTISVSAISPNNVTEGTVATITGTNLSASGLAVYFQGVQGTVQSVSATEIKVVVPHTSSGSITFKIKDQTAIALTALLFTYYDTPLVNPYISGDVILLSQADVDTFVKINKGRSFAITGNLTIGPAAHTQGSDINSLDGLSGMISGVSGLITINAVGIAQAPFLNTITTAGGLSMTDCSFTSVELNSLKDFSGSIYLWGLTNLSSLKLNMPTKIADLTLFNCPQLSDLSCLGNLRTAGSISLSMLSVTAVKLDQMTSMNSLAFNFESSLSSISLKALTNMNGSLSAQFCPKLSTADFTALTTMTGRLTFYNTAFSDLSGFKNLQSLGALYLKANPLLTSLQDLQHVTELTMPAINGAAHVAAGPSGGFLGIEAVLGGVTIESNAALTSLAGLENIKSLPVAYIYNNKVLNDLCPFKTALTALSTMPGYAYTLIDDPAGMTYTRQTPALTWYSNGNYTNTQDALNALALCH